MTPNVLHVVIGGLVVGAVACGSAHTEPDAAPDTAGPQTITITVNADGTFTPSMVAIKTGDTVVWEGLRRTDSIVHLADDAVDACDPNDGAPYVQDGIDEFSGPWRTGVPGLFARGPTDPGQGPGVIPATSNCDRDPNPELATVNGVPSKYCSGQFLPQHLLTEIWDYPEINGALILFDWKAIETADDVYDFTDLDHELTAAMKAGKSIRLGIRAGQEGTPAWIFPAGVVPVHTKDTNDSDLSLTGNNCGRATRMASPNDPRFRELWFDLIADVAAHVHTNAGWTMALNEWMLDGLNRLSDEAKLPQSCLLDGDKLATVNGDACVCNPKAFADAGYTPQALYEFYALQRVAAQAAFGRISMSYRLIQDGFPKVASATNYEGDSKFDLDGTTPLCTACSSADDTSLPRGTEQTETVIDQGVADEDADVFVTFHNGLGPLPQGQGAPRNCSWGMADLSEFPIFPHVPVNREPGCPNPWAVNAGIERGHITAGQVNNPGKGVDTPGEHEAALLNALFNSDYVSVELYASKVWDMHYDIGPNNDMDPTRASLGCIGGDPTKPSPGTVSPIGAAPCSVAPFSNSLVEYNDMFTERRKIYAGAAYPSSHSHTFTAAHAVLQYTNPGVCSRGPGSIATIIVTD